MMRSRPNRRPCWIIAVLAGAALASACASGPPPLSYLLEPASVLDGSEAAASTQAIGLATVGLPGYVKESSVAVRGDGLRLLVDEDAQWAEAPDAAITRVLAESLRLRAGATVLVEPLPRGFDPGARIEIVFDELLGTRAGGVDMSGQVRILDGEGRDLLDVLGFQLSHRGGGDSRDAYFDAISLGLDDLARLIVQRLQRAPA